MTDLSALNARFGLSGQVVSRQGPGGLDVEVANSGQRHRGVAGAQVLTWRHAGCCRDLAIARRQFAPGKSIRGGVPVCWPWFGPHATVATLPAHGFARTVPGSHRRTNLGGWCHASRFRLVLNEAARAQWPHATLLESHITWARRSRSTS
jgi:glucose-6-phosphate 1-epimerase